MSDQCRYCIYRGEPACESVDCSIHDSWYAQKLKAENKALRKLLESHCQTLEARYDASDDAADYEAWQLLKEKDQ